MSQWASHYPPTIDAIDLSDPIDRSNSLARNLVAYYPGVLSNRSLMLRDAGRRYHLTMNQARWDGGEYGPSTLSSSGNTMYADFPTNFPRLSGAFTFATLIYPTEINSGFPYLFADWSAGGRNYLIYFNANTLTVETGNGSTTSDLNINSGVSANAWQVMIVRRLGSTVYITIDGATINSTGSHTGGTTANDRRLFHSGSGGNPMLGRAAWVAVWNRSLEDSEVATLSNRSRQWDLLRLEKPMQVAEAAGAPAPSIAPIAMAQYMRRRRTA